MNKKSNLLFYIFQDEYFAKYGGSVIPVEPNDVFFSLHAVVLTTVTIVQCFIFEVSSKPFAISYGIIYLVHTQNFPKNLTLLSPDTHVGVRIRG